MEWRAWAAPLKAELDMELEPVAVGFLGAAPAGAPAPGGKVSVCQALKRAAGGETVILSADVCGCPGGLVNLGLGQTPEGGRERLVSFLVDKEKVYCSRVALHRSQQVVTPPLGLAPFVAFAPLAQAAFQPDLVLFLGRPGGLNHLVSLANYWEGGALAVDLAGPMCRTGISLPLGNGGPGLSLLDSGARRLAGFPEDLLLLTLPLHRVITVVAALAEGVRKPAHKNLEAMEREIDALGPVTRA
jgi:uncharacterized protein (DUF169 family)